MKSGKIAIAATILAIASTISTAPASAQPSWDGRYAPGFWQPKARNFVEVENPIQISLINNTGFAVNYEINQEETKELLAANSIDLTGLYINPYSSRDLDRNINVFINPANERQNAQLHFDVKIGANNRAIVRIRRRYNDNETRDKALYIDENGRIYIF